MALNLLLKLIFLFCLIALTKAQQPIQPRRTGYNEQFARLMFFMTAGAYSPNPEGCVNETARVAQQPLQLYSQSTNDCDVNGNTCAYYVAVSPTARQIFIIFRGTKGKKQLFHETLQSLQPNVDFYGHGKVNRYFFRALNSLWQQSSAVLTDPRYRDFTVTFTGHSLGGALASLAAMRAVLEQLRAPQQVKVYTFGQPRVGNHKFAVDHDLLVPETYRIVNRNDVVPHLPFCHFSDSTDPINDDAVVDSNNPRPIEPSNLRESDSDSESDFNLSDAIKQPCNGDGTRKAYHAGTEIWYPDGMTGEATYVECLGEPKNEDHTCSNGVHLGSNWSTWSRYVGDHLHYFGKKVSKFGKAGCRLEEIIPQPTHVAGFGSEKPPSKFQMAVFGVLDKLNNLRNG